jgi:hypothetical protein
MKFGYLILTLIIILSACSTPSGSQTSFSNGNEKTPSEEIHEPILPSENSPTIDSAFREDGQTTKAQTELTGQFQSFFQNIDNVKVVESREVEWSDSCLGVDQPGVDCISQPTQGFEIKLEANGLQFDYHADQVGGQVRPATIGLIWTRQGGENKICDRLIIYLPDEAHTCWCNEGEMHTAKVNLQDILSMEEYEQLMDLLRHFTKNSIDNSINVESKSKLVDVALTFHGQGQTTPQTADQLILLNMAEKIFSRISH